MKKLPIMWFRKKRPTVNRTTTPRPAWRRYGRVGLINAWKGAAFTLGGIMITWLIPWLKP
ncbi:hypothetical protein [Streptomyces sp. NPDC001380]|uniref:hypothetical protein n=1 Tax=Streptomyces sp. NPDC001380 TaxID=3364566 RepID=UPI003699B7EE